MCLGFFKQIMQFIGPSTVPVMRYYCLIRLFHIMICIIIIISVAIRIVYFCETIITKFIVRKARKLVCIIVLICVHIIIYLFIY